MQPLGNLISVVECHNSMKLPTAVLKLVYYSSGSPPLEMGPPRRGLVSFPSRAVYSNLRTALTLPYEVQVSGPRRIGRRMFEYQSGGTGAK